MWPPKPVCSLGGSGVQQRGQSWFDRPILGRIISSFINTGGCCMWCGQSVDPHSPGELVDSMREAVFIVSPKMENLGSLKPTRPVT